MPGVRLHLILGHALALVVADSQIGLSCSVILVGGLAIPLRRLRIILRHALATPVAVAQTVLIISVILLGSLAIPLVFPSVHSSPRICLRGTLASLRTKSRVSPRIEEDKSENSSGIFPLPRFLGCFKRGPFLAETEDSWLRALDWAVHGSGRNRNAERTADDVKIEGAELVFISCLWLFWSHDHSHACLDRARDRNSVARRRSTEPASFHVRGFASRHFRCR